ncbi:hypothetical protein NB636_01590 [Oxalobacter aliiformigenes]|uniref:hypothetical protein n=1 Tax=Oxalobacter aliiformigenes TaxID=2946593 RepID=UPI0022AFC639|nr:hypothetical protein [Oxalobacter aliiformigenes]MCZ4065519.1 hypothetical protein [Oxalobacter aliiformigenes]WAV99583.1 hypothetical protein NB636_01590 [Oxalobacter aliiformigenes]
MHLRRYLLLLLSGLAILHQATASASEKVSGSSGLTDILLAAGIVAIVFLVFVFSIYVRHHRNSSAMLLSRMYGTILEGRLHVLIVNLQDSMECLCVDVDENELGSFSLDGLWRLDGKSLREDFLDLAQKNGLGIVGKRNLQRGFDCLCKAVCLMSRLPVKTAGTVWLLPRKEREELQNLLIESIDSFEAVKRKVNLW